MINSNNNFNKEHLSLIIIYSSNSYNFWKVLQCESPLCAMLLSCIVLFYKENYTFKGIDFTKSNFSPFSHIQERDSESLD